MSTIPESKTPERGYTRETSLRDTGAPSPIEVPRAIDRYRVLKLIGSGGMGEVYVGHDGRLDRLVAIKRVRPDRRNTNLQNRLAREAIIAGRIASNNVVQVFDLIEVAGAEHIISEFVDGQSARERASGGPLELSNALNVIMDVTRGLKAAHDAGVTHRDLKSENVIIGEDGVSKIADFGVAQARGYGPPQSGGLIMGSPRSGTVRSMSPEQTLGLDTDFRTDLFALGTLSYELLSGQSPFVGANAETTMENIRTTPHVPLAEAVPGLPLPLSELVDTLLQKEPEMRPESCDTVLLRLEELAAALAVPAQPSDRVTKRHGAVVALRAEIPLGDPTRAAMMLANWHADLREAASRYSGTVVYAADCEALVCIGYPISHTNNSAAAAHFAAECVSSGARSPHQPMAIRSGIDAGELVFVGARGGPQLFGAAVRTCLALARDASKPGVLLTQRVQSRVVPHFETTAVTTDSIAGGRVAYGLGAARDGEPFAASELFGREKLMGEIEQTIALLHRGAPASNIALVAEPGGGKSRLAQAAIASAAGRIRCVGCRGLEMQRYRSFAPVQQLLQALPELRSGPTAAVTRGSIVRFVDEHLDRDADTVAALARVCGVASDRDSERLRRGHSTVDRTDYIARVTATAVAELAKQRSTLVVAEDLHFFDQASRKFLDHLALLSDALALAVLCTTRPEEGVVATLANSFVVRELAPLSDAEGAKIVEACCHGAKLPPAAGREIVRNAAGNPLALEELTRALLELDSADAEPSRVPVGVAESVTARLDRLPGATVDLARLAATLGDHTDERILRAVAAHSVELDLHRLRSASILARTPGVAFRHGLTRDAVLAGLAAPTRAALHRKVLATLEASNVDWARPGPEVLAHHAEGANMRDRAARLWIAAGEEALESLAAATACQHFDAAARLAGGDTALELEVLRKAYPALWTAHGWKAEKIDQVLARLDVLDPVPAEGKPILALFMDLSGLFVTGAIEALDAAFIKLRREAAGCNAARQRELNYLTALLRGICCVQSGPPAQAEAHLSDAIALLGKLDPSFAAGRPEPVIMARAYRVWLPLLAGDVTGAMKQQCAMEDDANSELERAVAQAFGIPACLSAHDWQAASDRGRAVAAFAAAGGELPPQIVHTAQLAAPIADLMAASAAGKLDVATFDTLAARMDEHFAGWHCGVMRTSSVLYRSIMASPCLEVASNRALGADVRARAGDVAGRHLSCAAELLAQGHPIDANWAAEAMRQKGELAHLQGDRAAAAECFAAGRQWLRRFHDAHETDDTLLGARLRESERRAAP